MIKKIQLRNTNKYTLLDNKDYNLVKDVKWYLFKSFNKEYAYSHLRIKDGKIIKPLTFSQIAKIRRPKKGRRFLSVDIFPEDQKLKQVFLHRYITNTPKGMEVDHINGNGLDNRKVNLRICTRAENGRNRKMSIKNKSGYHGVHFANTENRKKRWTAMIRFGGKKRYIGRYFTVEEAARAYDEKAKIYHGEYATLNFRTTIDKKEIKL